MRTLIPLILTISYFYIAIWVYENISRIFGIVIGFGVVGLLIDLICQIKKCKKDKK
jgi:hypothetical protein